LTAQIARFYHWPPESIDAFTVERLEFFVDQANRMIAAEAKARRR
jgi:hypothetical protein